MHTGIGIQTVSSFNLKIRNTQRNRPLGRPGHRWEGNIKMDFRFKWFS
jgi:hypothetical protein